MQTPGASPGGGPATQLGILGVTEGPPSVSGFVDPSPRICFAQAEVIRFSFAGDGLYWVRE